jgi:hypothetical protein
MKVNAIIKIAGFTVLLATLIVLLRPDLFWKKKVKSDDTVISIDDEAYNNSKKPSLMISDKSKIKDGHTEYADGYSSKDFDAMKEPENMFKTDEEKLTQSAGGLWEVFLKLRFDITYDPMLDDVAMRPLFTPEIKNYNNKTIEMQGYIIPNDIVHGAVGERGNGTVFMLSAYPTAACFFCKGAGPESVMEVYPKKPIPYHKNVVKIRGRLELNENDYMKMAYLLKDAQLVE